MIKMGSFNLTDLTMMKSRLESGGLVRMEDPSEELAGREGGTFSDKESETVTSLLPAAAGSAAPLPRKARARHTTINTSERPRSQ